MLSPYRIPTNKYKRGQNILNTNLDNISNRKNDLIRPQKTSNNLKMTSKEHITN